MFGVDMGDFHIESLLDLYDCHHGDSNIVTSLYEWNLLDSNKTICWDLLKYEISNI